MCKGSYQFTRLIRVSFLFFLTIAILFLITDHDPTAACAESMQNTCPSCPTSVEVGSTASPAQSLGNGPSADSISAKLLFPVQGLYAYTTRISSVLDHNRTLGIINAYTGERGRTIDGEHTETTTNKKTTLYGFLNSSNNPFYLTGKYTGGGDSSALWYENSNSFQHPGYDYPVAGTIIAPASGDLYIVIQDPSPDTLYSETWCRFHTFKIKVDNEPGLETWFLHAQRFVNPKDDGAGTRDLDAKVREKMGGNAYYNCNRQVSGDEVYVDHVAAGEKLAIVGGWGQNTRNKNQNETYPKHLHFEVRLNGNLIDPYGWEGDSDDPLTGNSEDVLWDGYTKPAITSAALNASSSTLTITGNNFIQTDQNPVVQLWRKFENSLDSSNKNDGTYIRDLTTGSISNTQTVTSVDQDILDNYSNYVVKVRIPNGPRSRASEMNLCQMWTKIFGETNTYNWANSVRQTTDGGYIVAGTFDLSGSGPRYIYLIKTDPSGSEVWDKIFVKPNPSIWGSEGYNVEQTTDGGYIVVGTLFYSGSGGIMPPRYAWLIKTDANGNEQWDRIFDDGLYNDGRNVRQTTDGGYIIVGSSYPWSGIAWLTKTDANGNELWQKTFFTEGSYSADGYSVEQTTDGGYIVVGNNHVPRGDGGYNPYVWLIKTDDDGNKIWDNMFGQSNGSASGYSVEQTADGGYIVLGSFNSDNIWLIKTDIDGNEVWDKVLYGYAGYDVRQTVEGGYIVAGRGSVASSYDARLIKTDADGNIMWNKTIGGLSSSTVVSVRQTTDDGYIATGLAPQWYGDGLLNICLIKADVYGNTVIP